MRLDENVSISYDDLNNSEIDGVRDVINRVSLSASSESQVILGVKKKPNGEYPRGFTIAPERERVSYFLVGELKPASFLADFVPVDGASALRIVQKGQRDPVYDFYTYPVED